MLGEITYKMVMPGVVEITERWLEKTRLDLAFAEKAVQNTIHEHTYYATEEVYQRNLSKYKGALAFLQANTQKN